VSSLQARGATCQRPRPLCLLHPTSIQRLASGKGYATASQSAPPPPSLRRHQWRYITGQRCFQFGVAFNGATETASSPSLKGDDMAASSSTTSPPHGHHDWALAILEDRRRCLVVQGQGQGADAKEREEPTVYVS
jgi:hypothetical protein